MAHLSPHAAMPLKKLMNKRPAGLFPCYSGHQATLSCHTVVALLDIAGKARHNRLQDGFARPMFLKPECKY